VKQPDTFGRRGTLELAVEPRFANAAVGFWCGHFNRLTVVDVDSAADSELQYALDTFGPSPVLVRTASGKHHAYYRHGGERRRIRPLAGYAIDFLGEGGFCVAPPSVRSDGGRYEFVRGGLSDLANLPTMRPVRYRSPSRLNHGLTPRGPSPRSAGAMMPCSGWRWPWPGADGIRERQSRSNNSYSPTPPRATWKESGKRTSNQRQ